MLYKQFLSLLLIDEPSLSGLYTLLKAHSGWEGRPHTWIMLLHRLKMTAMGWGVAYRQTVDARRTKK